MSETTYYEEDDFEPTVVIRGPWTGTVCYLWNTKREQERRDNLIANRGVRPVRTDYGV